MVMKSFSVFSILSFDMDEDSQHRNRDSSFRLVVSAFAQRFVVDLMVARV
jgi:hypothetical protein